MVVVVEGEVHYSDSDSDDDDDVDRYVFLARHPAPAAGHRHADDDRGASSANDDDEDDDGDGDATADEEEPERSGGRRRKRKPLGREILDDGAPPPPPKKKARSAELIAPPIAHTLPSGSGSETESDSAALPCVDARAGESGSEGSHDHEKKVHGRRAPGRRGEAKNAKRVACGKRGRRGPGCEADGDRAVTATAAAKAGAPPAATSGRFPCNLCERCFGSHQALGGHVLGHRKKARIAIAAAAGLDDVDDAGGVIGNCKEETAVVIEANDNKAAGGIAQADKMVAAAARRGKVNGDGGCHGKIKTVDGVAEHRDDVGFGNEGNVIAVSSHGFTSNGGNSRSNGKTGMGAAIPNQKLIDGSCHEGDTANGDGNGVRRTMYKCKVCGTECSTGRALGGHMRKHRKRPPPGGGEDGRSPSPPTDDDCQIPLSRLFAAENTIGLI